ncbi:hypothetical protein L208DRAFT_1402236 [Tricholoma matsutake]|nr:hypothetical protein L208DRAFT_1402236 [Tricholoma matsutake 945]
MDVGELGEFRKSGKGYVAFLGYVRVYVLERVRDKDMENLENVSVSQCYVPGHEGLRVIQHSLERKSAVV